MDARPLATATLAGGCYWCLEAVFGELAGVERVEPGFAGGHVEDPTYEQVCGGRTGHAEVVRITFDPAVVSYPDLLEVFFAFHDPTTPDRQGADVGTQYRSAIFTHDAAQERDARATIAALTAAGVFAAPIVTQVAPLEKFHPAPGYHRDYYAGHAEEPYCRATITPKIQKLRAKYRARLKSAEENT
jgi:peptide-methionine (S)-S-oxide reductase